jgi:uncharacterized protein YbjQ (UPF0145 family)
MFPDDVNLVEFLTELLEKAKNKEIDRLVAVYSNKELTGNAVIGIQNLNQVTEMIGYLEVVKTSLTMTVMQGSQEVEE